jgi:hypothetical protein
MRIIASPPPAYPKKLISRERSLRLPSASADSVAYFQFVESPPRTWKAWTRLCKQLGRQ